jgi:hypothetical protein
MADQSYNPKQTGRIVYNLDMARAIRRIKQPVKGLVMDIKGLPNFLAVTVYEENILEYNDYQREAIMSYLIMVRDVIRSYNVPCELNGETYMPRGGRV